MNKVIILGDPHAGVHNGSSIFSNFQISYLKTIIDHCVTNNIREIWCLGDVFEVRKNTNTEVLDDWKIKFFDLLLDKKIVFRTLVGNHDMYYKNTINPNAVKVHLESYENVVIYDSPQTLQVNDKSKVLFVPWICKENEEEILKKIENTSANIILGHFEVKGAKMESSICEDGLPLSLFSDYDIAISGHFHVRGLYENMRYVGTPYETSWADYGEVKGFHVLDLDTHDMEFHPNKNNLFYKIIYKESIDMDQFLYRTVNGKNEYNFNDCFVRVIVEEREDYKRFENWLMKLENLGMRELKIIEPIMERTSEDSDIEFNGEIDPMSTSTLISDYISEVYPERENKLNNLMQGLHNEALNTME